MEGKGLTHYSQSRVDEPQTVHGVKEILMAAEGNLGNAPSFPGIQVWDLVEKVACDNNTWTGTFKYKDTELIEGKVVSRTHADIIPILAEIRSHHEGEFSAKTRVNYSAAMKYVQLQCACGRRSFHAEERERTGESQRFVEGLNVQCNSSLSLRWSVVGDSAAWVVGKCNATHTGHPKPQQKVVRLTDEQRRLFGQEMVDANLSASQVSHSVHLFSCRCSMVGTVA